MDTEPRHCWICFDAISPPHSELVECNCKTNNVAHVDCLEAWANTGIRECRFCNMQWPTTQQPGANEAQSYGELIELPLVELVHFTNQDQARPHWVCCAWLFSAYVLVHLTVAVVGCFFSNSCSSPPVLVFFVMVGDALFFCFTCAYSRLLLMHNANGN